MAPTVCLPFDGIGSGIPASGIGRFAHSRRPWFPTRFSVYKVASNLRFMSGICHHFSRTIQQWECALYPVEHDPGVIEKFSRLQRRPPSRYLTHTHFTAQCRGNVYGGILSGDFQRTLRQVGLAVRAPRQYHSIEHIVVTNQVEAVELVSEPKQTMN